MTIEPGDYILLYSPEKKRSWLVKVEEGKVFSTDLGNIDLDTVLGKEYGYAVETHLGKKLYLFRPSPRDYIMKGVRPTQIIYPKDIGYIIHTLGIRHDTKFLEVGTGSGGLTIGVAWIMSREGLITTYERREDFRRNAERNIARIKPECQIRFRGEFPDNELEEDFYDVAFIDMDTPWKILPNVYRALKGGGRIGLLIPTYTQLEKIYDEFNRLFIHLEAVETFVRNIQFKKGRIRPEFRMIGYTAVLLFGIKREE